MAPNDYEGSPYFVEVFSLNMRWRRHRATWAKGFPSYGKALGWAERRIREVPRTFRVRIICQGMVCWIEPENYKEYRREVYAETNQPQEDKGMATITEPLNIPRDSLIARLQEVADEAKAKREEAQASVVASRQALLDAVAKLTADQVANVLDYSGVLGGDALAQVTEWVDEKKFVSQDIEPSFVETTLERSIRVLNLASDNTIKVQPNDEIYAYL